MKFKNKKSRKAQNIGQIFIYIFSIIIAGLIFLYGYNAIKKLMDTREELKLKELERNTYDTIASVRYGDVKKLVMSMPSGYNEVCFVDSDAITGGTITTGPDHSRIKKSVESKVKKNLFLYPGGSVSFYVGELEVNREPSCNALPCTPPNTRVYLDGQGQHYACFSVAAGVANVRLEGLGDRVNITGKWADIS